MASVLALSDSLTGPSEWLAKVVRTAGKALFRWPAERSAGSAAAEFVDSAEQRNAFRCSAAAEFGPL